MIEFRNLFAKKKSEPSWGNLPEGRFTGGEAEKHESEKHFRTGFESVVKSAMAAVNQEKTGNNPGEKLRLVQAAEAASRNLQRKYASYKTLEIRTWLRAIAEEMLNSTFPAAADLQRAKEILKVDKMLGIFNPSAVGRGVDRGEE